MIFITVQEKKLHYLWDFIHSSLLLKEGAEYCHTVNYDALID